MSEPIDLPPVPSEMLEWAQAFTGFINADMKDFHNQLETFRMEFSALIMQVNEKFDQLNQMQLNMQDLVKVDQEETHGIQERSAAALERIAKLLER